MSVRRGRRRRRDVICWMGGNWTCTSVEPNKMGFRDDEPDEGVMHHVYLPEGTFQAASLHYQDENSTVLKRFPERGQSFFGSCCKRKES